MLQHIGFVKDGSIGRFSHSADSYMKVCNPVNGVGGVVGLSTGIYIPVSDLPKFDLGPLFHIDWNNLSELISVYCDEEEEEDEDE